MGGTFLTLLSDKGLLPITLNWAMTVHKAQGSEFERVVLCLAGDDSRVLCRELIYTGITRARSRVDIVAEAEVVKAGIEKMAERVSGLGGGQQL